MLEDSYPLGFKLNLHNKDLKIALKVARESGLDLPISQKIKEVEDGLISDGFGDLDISVIRRSIKS